MKLAYYDVVNVLCFTERYHNCESDEGEFVKFTESNGFIGTKITGRNTGSGCISGVTLSRGCTV